MKILPAEELLPYIKYYMFIDVMDNSELRLIPDGTSGMVLTNSVMGLSSDTRQTECPLNFLYGQRTRSCSFTFRGDGVAIIVVFQPYGLTMLTGIPANLLNDEIVSLRSVFDRTENLFCNSRNQDGTPHIQKAMLDRFFAKKRSAISRSGIMEMQKATDFIISSKGAFTPNHLKSITGWSQRHIERRFSETVGLSPKKLAGIIRMNFFIKQLLAADAQENISDIAFDAGYYDQAHLNREFKKLTGITPSRFRRECSATGVYLEA